MRLRCAELLKLTDGSDALNFLWVVDFPLLAFSPGGLQLRDIEVAVKPAVALRARALLPRWLAFVTRLRR